MPAPPRGSAPRPSPAGSPGGSPGGSSGGSPAVLAPVLVVLALEALTLVAVAVFAIRAFLAGQVSSIGLTVGVVVLVVGVAAMLAASARALAGGRRWGRAPALTWQLLQLAVAVPGLRSDSPLVSAALLVAAAVVLVGLFLPAVVRHTSNGGQPRTL